jgi:hypothetical protein
MINILLFDNNSNLNEALQHSLGGVESVKVITPNPVIADIARIKFESAHENLETVTISHFLKNELKQLIEQQRLENFQGKAELNILLGSLWKVGRPDSSYELFKRSFQMLTDFRSFSMNEDILQTILEDYEEELGGAVFWFHKLMMEMDIIDEHRSYFLLSERLRAGDLPPLYKTNQTYIFFGFDFLTASQVDLLNALGIRDNIFVPFPREAYEKSTDLDWIRWLSKSDAEIIEAKKVASSSQSIKIAPFPKNYLAKTLKNLRYHDDFKNGRMNIVLGTKNLSPELVSEIPFTNMSFKVSIDLFKEKVGLARKVIERAIEKKIIHHEELTKVIQQESKVAIKDKDYRYYKVLSLFLEQLIKWVSLSENNEMIGEFDLKIIFDSVMLNAPRNSLFSGSADSEGTKSELKTLKSIDKAEDADFHFLCITSEHGPVKGNIVQYSENVEKYLASIGPIRRSELEFLQLKTKIQEFLERENTFVLVEDGLLEHDLGWSNILVESRREFITIESSWESSREFILSKKSQTSELKSISATRLQSYRDCPQKYYANYIEKSSPRIELPGQLNFLQIGLLEHKVIEDYLKYNKEFNDERFLALVLKTLNDFKQENPFKEEIFEEYRLELVALCTNIIKELLVLNAEIGLELKCEVQLPSNEEYKILGSIDCLGKNENTLVILDFKRGGSSIPSQKGLKDFKKIQLWFYLERMRKNGLFGESTKLIWGYINLSKLEESLVYCNDEVYLERFKSSGLKAFSKMIHFNDEYTDLIGEYEEFEQELIDKLTKEKEFKPNPIENLTCQYCHIANICPRGEF